MAGFVPRQARWESTAHRVLVPRQGGSERVVVPLAPGGVRLDEFDDSLHDGDQFVWGANVEDEEGDVLVSLAIPKVLVARQDDQRFACRHGDDGVVRRAQWEEFGERHDPMPASLEPISEWLRRAFVPQESEDVRRASCALHAQATPADVHCRAASISRRVSEGKRARISSGERPSSIIRRTSATGMRVSSKTGWACTTPRWRTMRPLASGARRPSTSAFRAISASIAARSRCAAVCSGCAPARVTWSTASLKNTRRPLTENRTAERGRSRWRRSHSVTRRSSRGATWCRSRRRTSARSVTRSRKV